MFVPYFAGVVCVVNAAMCSGVFLVVLGFFICCRLGVCTFLCSCVYCCFCKVFVDFCRCFACFFVSFVFICLCDKGVFVCVFCVLF